MPANPTPKTKPPAARVPRARVMYSTSRPERKELYAYDKPTPYLKHCTTILAVLPCPTLRQAKAMAAWGNKTQEEKVLALAKVIWRCHRDSMPPQTGFLAKEWKQLPEWGREMRRNEARAILQLLTGHSAKST